MTSGKPEIREDRWVRTMCGRCYAMCAIRVHVIDGVAVKIEGEPEKLPRAPRAACAARG